VFIASDGIGKVIEALRDSESDVTVRKSALDCLKMLCVYGITSFIFRTSISHYLLDDFRTEFISVNGIEKLITTLQDSDWKVRTSALDFFKTACHQGTTCYNPEVSISHYIPDDIPTKLILINGLEKLVETLWDSDSDVRASALTCLEMLYKRGIVFSILRSPISNNFSDDIRKKFLANDSIEKLIVRFENSHLDARMRNSILDCLKVLCTQGIIGCDIEASI